jgi:acetyl-CoA carboxylase carboxyltransferase component
MAGQGFDPDFVFTWPTGRMGVMEGESAVQAVYGERAADAELGSQVGKMRADYDQQLDAKYAAARGYVDAILEPEETREMLSLALSVAATYRGPHLGAFVLPPLDASPDA